MSKLKKRSTVTVFLAVLFVLAWLGVMFTLFPVSNPLNKIGGTAGLGFFYAALLALGLLIVILLFLSIRASLKDIIKSVGDDIGVDVGQVGRDYKRLLIDEILVLIGKKKKISDHHDD